MDPDEKRARNNKSEKEDEGVLLLADGSEENAEVVSFTSEDPYVPPVLSNPIGKKVLDDVVQLLMARDPSHAQSTGGPSSVSASSEADEEMTEPLAEDQQPL